MLTLNVSVIFTYKLLNEFHDGIFLRKTDKKLSFRWIMSIPYLDVAELATIQSEMTKSKSNSKPKAIQQNSKK